MSEQYRYQRMRVFIESISSNNDEARKCLIAIQNDEYMDWAIRPKMKSLIKKQVSFKLRLQRFYSYVRNVVSPRQTYHGSIHQGINPDVSET